MDIFEKLNTALVKRESNKQLLQERIAKKEELIKEMETVMKSQVLLQNIAGEVQSQLSSKIDTIVNLGLQTCFPEYNFHLEPVPSRGKTEYHFVFKLGKDEVDPLTQNGGGFVDLICFLLRVAVFTISNTSSQIVFDEPFKFVSRTLRPKVAELLSAMSEQMNLQFIYVTHIDELSETANKKILVKKIKGVSEIC